MIWRFDYTRKVIGTHWDWVQTNSSSHLLVWGVHAPDYQVPLSLLSGRLAWVWFDTAANQWHSRTPRLMAGGGGQFEWRHLTHSDRAEAFRHAGKYLRSIMYFLTPSSSAQSRGHQG